VPVRTHEWILLLSGFSTANGIGGFFIIAFFILFAIRARFSHAIAGRHFNQIQIILGIAALAALISLITTLPQGLLSTPQMFIAGNQSGPYQYNWYLDRSPSTFINSFVFSLPMWVYRVAMLAWSFWLALTLPRWGKWGWECFKTNGIWKKINKSPKTARKNSQSENKKGNNIEMTDRVS
jgi:hypothetical protein